MYNRVHLSVHLPNDITQPFLSNTWLKEGCHLSPIFLKM